VTSPGFAARRFKRHRYELLVEEALDPIVALDAAGHLVRASRSIVSLTHEEGTTIHSICNGEAP
jgi:hypothetical protein